MTRSRLPSALLCATALALLTSGLACSSTPRDQNYGQDADGFEVPFEDARIDAAGTDTSGAAGSTGTAGASGADGADAAAGAGGADASDGGDAADSTVDASADADAAG
jgi:hypothetical protein